MIRECIKLYSGVLGLLAVAAICIMQFLPVADSGLAYLPSNMREISQAIATAEDSNSNTVVVSKELLWRTRTTIVSLRLRAGNELYTTLALAALVAMLSAILIATYRDRKEGTN